MKKFPAFNRHRRFAAVFPGAHPISLSGIRSIQSETSHSISWTPILLLLAELQLCPSSNLIHSGLSIKTLYSFFFSPTHTTCSAHLILFDFITAIIFDEQHIHRSSSTCKFLRPPVTSCLLGSSTFPSTLFSDTISLCPSLDVRGQVSHSYKTAGKITVDTHYRLWMRPFTNSVTVSLWILPDFFGI